MSPPRAVPVQSQGGQMKKTPLAAGSLSPACVEESSLLYSGTARYPTRSTDYIRVRALLESPGLLPSRGHRCLSCLLYKQRACQRSRRRLRCVMLYLGRGSSVAQCPLFEAFAPAAGVPDGSGKAGGAWRWDRPVKIIDALPRSTLWRPPPRTTQTIECTVEFLIIWGVNELDTGDCDLAQGVSQVMDNGVRVGYHDVRAGCRAQRRILRRR